MMIGENEVMKLLLQACPSFAKSETWRLEPEYGLYVNLGFFANHLAELLKEGKTEEITATFITVERLLSEGDRSVQKEIVVELLEATQRVLPRHTVQSMRQYLQPKSAELWENIKPETNWLKLWWSRWRLKRQSRRYYRLWQRPSSN